MPHPIRPPRLNGAQTIPSFAVLHILECVIAVAEAALHADFPELGYDDLRHKVPIAARRTLTTLRELDHQVGLLRHLPPGLERPD